MVAARKRQHVEQGDGEWPQFEAGPAEMHLHMVERSRVARRERTFAELRAMALWPRLDLRVLAYARGDASRLARAISRQRTAMTEEQVRRLLTQGERD